MSEHVSPDKTVDVLAQQRGLQDGSLESDVVREHQAYEVSVAGDVRRRGSVDVRYSNGIQSELSCNSLAHHALGCASVNYSKSRDWRRDGGARGSESRLEGRSDGKPELSDRTDDLEVWDLTRERGQTRRRARWT